MPRASLVQDPAAVAFARSKDPRKGTEARRRYDAIHAALKARTEAGKPPTRSLIRRLIGWALA